MSDDLTRHTLRDAQRINTRQKWEMQYWTRKFGVSEERLKAAAKAAGPMVKNIEKYLKAH
jgi:hypothetical protein